MLFFTIAYIIMPSPLFRMRTPDAESPLISEDDDYSILWLSRHILELDREIVDRVTERHKWQAMLDRKFAKEKAQEDRK